MLFFKRKQLPLPMGEGWGEGYEIMKTPLILVLLPEGEGTLTTHVHLKTTCSRI